MTLWDKVDRFFNGGPKEIVKTDLSSKVDRMLEHKKEALKLSDELSKEIAVTRADLTTATSKLVPDQTAPKVTP